MTAQRFIQACARLRPGAGAASLAASPDPVPAATKASLRRLARRCQQLSEEITEIDADLAPLVNAANPALIALKGVGVEVAAQLLATAGDNPERLRSEAAFAHLCGVAPLPASSGRTNRHRLNRGGDRAANHALHTIALRRMRWDPARGPTSSAAQAKVSTKKTSSDASLRYIVREVHTALIAP